jgi:hypothetical protein
MRRCALFIVVCVALVAGACSLPAPGATGTHSFIFEASKVTVVHHNDSFLYGTRDEPFTYNIWFRVKYGVPGSAQVGVAGNRDSAFNDLGDGQSHVYSGEQGAPVTFNNVKLLDIPDLIQPNNALEIVGTWTWAMEQDDISVKQVADDTASVMKDILNAVVASGNPPTDPNALVGIVTSDIGRVLRLVAGALFDSIPGLPDDAVGSRIYVGLSTGGTLSNIVDAALAAAQASIPAVQIPIVTVPPDIDGGTVFSLGHNSKFTNEVFADNGEHDLDIQVTNTDTINKPPIANAIASPISGPAPLAVSMNGGASADPDGSIVAYNWDFGDFTTGTGPINSHIFNQPGNYPVTLTVTDNQGAATATVIHVAVGGAPTAAPTGLQKVGSGCCDTYGDFAWNRIPGAERYQVEMDPTVGCIAGTYSNTIEGNVSSGRVQAVGLCLGTQYDAKIRAQANGLWGPWSSTIHFTL